ncbi:MAG TPA: amino acid ABC transporter substrate-binding protein [Candidatus Lustribacter sp.]|jgi:branched-chain amino acid transport system substrate-binding protein|nr:amino acid ABC transporter substrate-binding protein [Candidatus Lustribacter sp.]
MACIRVGALFALAVAGALALTTAVPVPARADDNTIVFGAALAATGANAREGALTKAGYDFWKDYVNAHGGMKVGGKTYKVDIKYYDDESNPQTAARLVERLVSEDKVNFILGPYGSANTATAAAVAERLKVPMVEGNGAAASIFSQGYKYTFAVLAPGFKYLQGILEMARTLKPAPKTVAISTANDTFSVEVGQGAADYANAHGMQVVYQNKYPADTTDVSAIVSGIKAANADIVLNGGHLDEALLLQRTLKEQNVNAKIFGYSVGPDTPDFRKTLGKDANWVFGGTQWSPTAKYQGAPGFIGDSKVYAAAFNKKYGYVPEYHNAESTAACLAFMYAIEKAGSLDPQKVRDALQNLDVVTFYGILKFDSRGINVYKPMAVNQIQHDDLMTVWPLGVQNAKPAYPTPAWSSR